MTIRAETVKVLDRISFERIRQDKLWGGPDHDDKHSNDEWYNIMLSQLVAATKALKGGDESEANIQLIHTAATIAAWVESRERVGRREGWY
jgi:hypothetical protein